MGIDGVGNFPTWISHWLSRGPSQRQKCNSHKGLLYFYR